MFGWEFPPVFAGGVGMACYHLTKELHNQKIGLDYVVPFSKESLVSNGFKIHSTEDSSKEISINSIKSKKKTKTSSTTKFSIHKIDSFLSAYINEDQYAELVKKLNCSQIDTSRLSKNKSSNTKQLYGEELLDEVELFKERLILMFKKEEIDENSFDIIHAHDWTTLPAAKAVKELTGKPFVAHVHITEFNKSAGGGINESIYSIEKEGLQAADKVIAVSKAIKQTLIDKYEIDPEKIRVIYNASTPLEKNNNSLNKDLDFPKLKRGSEKLVSFMGRITGMKGPENFVRVAKRVLEHRPNTKFLVAGTGDKLVDTINLSKQLGIYDKFYFHGFYTREEASYFFEQSDVFILPSLMEPFGLTPLEAMQKDTPVIVSKQSGVSEILNHCFKVDFWDIDKMASQVISLLTYPELRSEMVRLGRGESLSKTWEETSKELIKLYDELLRIDNKKNLIHSNNTHTGARVK